MTKRLLYLVGLTCLIVTVASAFSHQPITVAQEQPQPTEPGGVPDAPTLEPEVQATADALEAEWEQKYESRNIFDYYIAYLIGPDATEPDHYISAQAVEAEMGAVIFHSWDEFIAQNDMHPFQIILLHGSMIDQIDTEWTQLAYRNRVILVGMAMPYDEYVDITGDRCLYEPNPHLAEFIDRTAIIFSYAVHLENESLRPIIDEHELQLCSEDYDFPDEPYLVVHGLGMDIFSEIQSIMFLSNRLLIETMDYNVKGNKSEILPLPNMVNTTEPEIDSTPSLRSGDFGGTR